MRFIRKLCKYIIKQVILHFPGLLSFLRWIQQRKVIILAYHGVSPDYADKSTCLNLADCVVRLSDFKRQIEYLTANYNIISLSQYILWRHGLTKLPNNPCVLTFDDAYLDQYKYAFPILHKLSIKAVFFVIGAAISNPGSVWLFELYAILDSVSVRDCCNILCNQVEGFPSDDIKSKSDLRSWIVDYFGNLSRDERNRRLKEFRKALDARKIKTIEFITRDGLRELVEDGFEIGSHSMNHELLTGLSDEELAAEISNSKQSIMGLTKDTPLFFSYPHGCWNYKVSEELRKNGFVCAVAGRQGLNGKNNYIYDLKRISIDGNLTLLDFILRLLGFNNFINEVFGIFNVLEGSVERETKQRS